ncbi:MAG: RimK/LysX family protein [Proteobacteria bacterium]|nr:RimK/LysX family protein [Pseudomonadota bacterium]
MKHFFVSVLVVVIISVLAVAAARAQDVIAIGWVEEVRIYPGGVLIRAKIDTGARTASLNAQEIRRFVKEGKDWVAFSVKTKDGQTLHFEEPIFRVVKIKEHGAPSDERPVVLLGICLGNHFAQDQVNLADRSNFNYQMLIGRRFLKTHFAVDPNLSFTAKPNCPDAKP